MKNLKDFADFKALHTSNSINFTHFKFQLY
jgi:hypothetical protein